MARLLGRRIGTGPVAAALLLTAVATVGVVATGVAADQRDENVWTDRDGERLPDSVVSSFDGPEHCDWQDLVFLEIGYRSGLTQPGLSGRLTFLRDPDGVLADHLTSSFRTDVALPSGAVDTGWRRDGHDVWLDPQGDAAYVRLDGDRYERWPRSTDVACL